MKKSIFSLIFALLGVSALTTSCEDMLTPEMDRYVVDFTGKDTVNFYLGIMRNMQGMVEQNVLLGELRGDLVASTEYASDSISDILNFTNLNDGENDLLNRAAYYKVINQCNFYLNRADSMAMKNNSYYMRRELAQVQLVRAWTYMQLVQNYGKVPFITKPVDNSGTGWETNPEDWATNDNLLELLESKGGLKQAYTYSETLGYPNYGDFNTGATKFAHRMMTFNADLVYGDLYLLRGASKSDYEQAAYHYHKYLDEDCNQTVNSQAAVFKFSRSGVDTYTGFAAPWGNSAFLNKDFSGPGEYRTAIPSASNSFFGKMLTRITQVYGFDATSTNNTSTVVGSDNKETSTTSGRISLVANYRNRQLQPSNAILKLSAAQPFVYNEIENGKQTDVKYLELGDQRVYAAAPLVSTENGRIRFIHKFGASTIPLPSSALGEYSFNFRYGIPLYRARQIYLRYAEAINRAGYPRYAFAILRDGLSPETLPTFNNAAVSDTIFADDTKTDIVKIVRTVLPEIMHQDNGADGINYSELKRANTVKWLDFTKFADKKNMGTRVAGASTTQGFSSTINGFTSMDSVWTYDKVVAQRIVDEAARRGNSITAPQLVTKETNLPIDTVSVKITKAKNADEDEYEIETRTLQYLPTMPTAEEIAAVESIIAEEMALETAFEGSRYYDLMRLARHRNAAGEDGTAWMAWLISRRDKNLAPYEEPTTTGALYNFLLDQNNWYLPAPKNN